MLQDSANRRKLLGGIIATSVFVFWIFVDLYMFPILGLPYRFYELLSYGSWAIIALLCFGILSWTGWFPMRQQSGERDESPES